MAGKPSEVVARAPLTATFFRNSRRWYFVPFRFLAIDTPPFKNWQDRQIQVLRGAGIGRAFSFRCSLALEVRAWYSKLTTKVTA
jgi:hypothetical protein